MHHGTSEEMNFRHVGIVVPLLETAMTRLSDLVGSEWGEARDLSFDACDGDGTTLVVALRVVLSATEPGLELIEEPPGTPWVRNTWSNLHHIAFGSLDVGAASDALSAAHCPLLIALGGMGGSPRRFAYHRDPLGITIEVTKPLNP